MPPLFCLLPWPQGFFFVQVIHDKVDHLWIINDVHTPGSRKYMDSTTMSALKVLSFLTETVYCDLEPSRHPLKPEQPVLSISRSCLVTCTDRAFFSQGFWYVRPADRPADKESVCTVAGEQLTAVVVPFGLCFSSGFKLLHLCSRCAPR